MIQTPQELEERARMIKRMILGSQYGFSSPLSVSGEKAKELIALHNLPADELVARLDKLEGGLLE